MTHLARELGNQEHWGALPMGIKKGSQVLRRSHLGTGGGGGGVALVEALAVGGVIDGAGADLHQAQPGGVVLELAVAVAVAHGGLGIAVLATDGDLVALARLDGDVSRGGARAVGGSEGLDSNGRRGDDADHAGGNEGLEHLQGIGQEIVR